MHFVIVDSRDANPGDADAAIVIPTATVVASHVEILIVTLLLSYLHPPSVSFPAGAFSLPESTAYH
jgi:hypothetical protein